MSCTTLSNRAKPRTQAVAWEAPRRTDSDCPLSSPPSAPAAPETAIRISRPIGTPKPKVMVSTIEGLKLGRNWVMSKLSTITTNTEVTSPANRPETSPAIAPARGSRIVSPSGFAGPRAEINPTRIGIPSRTAYPIRMKGSTRTLLLKFSIMPMAAVKLIEIPAIRPRRRTKAKSLMPDPLNRAAHRVDLMV